MEKCYLTGTLLCFVSNYSTPVTKKYWALKKEKKFKSENIRPL